MQYHELSIPSLKLWMMPETLQSFGLFWISGFLNKVYSTGKIYAPMPKTKNSETLLVISNWSKGYLNSVFLHSLTYIYTFLLVNTLTKAQEVQPYLGHELLQQLQVCSVSLPKPWTPEEACCSTAITAVRGKPRLEHAWDRSNVLCKCPKNKDKSAKKKKSKISEGRHHFSVEMSLRWKKKVYKTLEIYIFNPQD